MKWIRTQRGDYLNVSCIREITINKVDLANENAFVPEKPSEYVYRATAYAATESYYAIVILEHPDETWVRERIANALGEVHNV
jgi:hypothetical protein